jgi:RimJ/RimL family protein N-acetyltransferase
MLPLTDGVVTLRTPQRSDRATLVAGRDAEHRKWLGQGADDPQPTACIVADEVVIGWVDADPAPSWLPPGGVNIGYSLFQHVRGHGLATRAVKLLLLHLVEQKAATRAIAAIDPDNIRSIGVVQRAGFIEVSRPDLGLGLIFERSIRSSAA